MEHMAYMTSASLFLKTETTKNAIPSKISQVLAISLHLTLLFFETKGFIFYNHPFKFLLKNTWPSEKGITLSCTNREVLEVKEKCHSSNHSIKKTFFKSGSDFIS